LTAALGSFYDYNAQEQLNVPEMTIVDDVTIGDGESVTPGAHFTKTWRLVNPGKHPWPLGMLSFFLRAFKHMFERNTYINLGCSLQRVGGSEELEIGCGGHTMSNQVPIPTAMPGQTVQVSSELVGPTKPGIYQSVWRLVTPNQVPFGGTQFYPNSIICT